MSKKKVKLDKPTKILFINERAESYEAFVKKFVDCNALEARVEFFDHLLTPYEIRKRFSNYKIFIVCSNRFKGVSDTDVKIVINELKREYKVLIYSPHKIEIDIFGLEITEFAIRSNELFSILLNPKFLTQMDTRFLAEEIQKIMASRYLLRVNSILRQ